jgi:hypothetical protein
MIVRASVSFQTTRQTHVRVHILTSAISVRYTCKPYNAPEQRARAQNGGGFSTGSTSTRQTLAVFSNSRSVRGHREDDGLSPSLAEHPARHWIVPVLSVCHAIGSLGLHCDGLPELGFPNARDDQCENRAKDPGP